jgi:hypothetical protein
MYAIMGITGNVSGEAGSRKGKVELETVLRELLADA